MEFFIRRTGAVLGTIRAWIRQIINRYFGTIEHFDGSAREICQQIVDRLWADNFYRTSLGHFDFFWMRDFGTVAQALIDLGYNDRVIHTLSWAMRHYRRAGAVTLCIDKAGNTFNAPAKKSIDAIPWLLHSLVVSHYRLTIAEKAFLERQLETYCKSFLDPKTGELLRVRYAEMRDAVNYNRSAYSIALIGRMAECADQLGLATFPFNVSTYQTILVEKYWTGRFFRADLDNDSYSSDSALMPFFLGVIVDKEKAYKTFDYIDSVGLNKPYPLIYCQQPHAFHYRFGMGNILMPNYTGTTIWTWHATFYLHTLKRYKHPSYDRHRDKFAEMIEKQKTYPELINIDGSWFKAPLYKADPGMIWAALFLAL